MTLSKTLLTAISALALMSPAAGALAQTAKPKPKAAATAAPAAAPAPPPPLQLGAAIPGVCVFSEEAAVSQSSAGRTINDRMKQLAAQVQAELGPEQTSLDADIKAFKALPQDQQQAQGPALQQRVQDFEGKRQLRQRELETTLRMLATADLHGAPAEGNEELLGTMLEAICQIAETSGADLEAALRTAAARQRADIIAFEQRA